MNGRLRAVGGAHLVVLRETRGDGVVVLTAAREQAFAPGAAARRFPEQRAEAATVREVFHRVVRATNGVGHRRRVRRVDRVFGEHELEARARELRHELVQHVATRRRAALIHLVTREPEVVEGDISHLGVLDEVATRREIAAPIEVQHDLDGRVDLVHGRDRRGEKLREVVPVRDAAVRRRRRERAVRLTWIGRHVHDHARRGFVADLRDVGTRAAVNERLDAGARVVVDLRCERLNSRDVAPRERLDLLARVGPVVAVVKIDDEAEPGLLDAPAHRRRVRDVAVALRRVAALRRRVHERAQSNPVEPVVLEELENVLLRAVVNVALPARLVLLHPREVGADHEGGSWGRSARAAGSAFTRGAARARSAVATGSRAAGSGSCATGSTSANVAPGACVRPTDPRAASAESAARSTLPRTPGQNSTDSRPTHPADGSDAARCRSAGCRGRPPPPTLAPPVAAPPTGPAPPPGEFPPDSSGTVSLHFSSEKRERIPTSEKAPRRVR